MKQNLNKYFNISLPYDKFARYLADYISSTLDFEQVILSKRESKILAKYLIESQEFSSFFKEYNFKGIDSVLCYFNVDRNLTKLFKNSDFFIGLLKKDKELSEKADKRDSENIKNIKLAIKTLEENGYFISRSGLS